MEEDEKEKIGRMNGKMTPQTKYERERTETCIIEQRGGEKS